MSKFKVFNEDRELLGEWKWILLEDFKRMFAGNTPLVLGQNGRITLIAREQENQGQWYPVTRKIKFKIVAKPHKCNDKCRHAKGDFCECECGGKFHGLG